MKPLSSGDAVLDLVVIGCGPAGLSLAAESAKKGLRVGLVGPDLPFTNNYGVWEDEFRGTFSLLSFKEFGSWFFIAPIYKPTIISCQLFDN